MQLSGEAPDFPVCPCHLGDGAGKEAACGLFVSMGHCSQLTPTRSSLGWSAPSSWPSNRGSQSDWVQSSCSNEMRSELRGERSRLSSPTGCWAHFLPSAAGEGRVLFQL